MRAAATRRRLWKQSCDVPKAQFHLIQTEAINPEQWTTPSKTKICLDEDEFTPVKLQPPGLAELDESRPLSSRSDATKRPSELHSPLLCIPTPQRRRVKETMVAEHLPHIRNAVSVGCQASPQTCSVGHVTSRTRVHTRSCQSSHDVQTPDGNTNLDSCADVETYMDQLASTGERIQNLLRNLTPIRIDECSHKHFIADSPELQRQISASNEILLPVSVDGVVRPLLTKHAVPLQLLQDALPNRLGVFSGYLCLGACRLDHDSETTAGDVLVQGYAVSFDPQSVMEFDLECLSEDMDEIFYRVCDENPDLSDDEHDTLAEQLFISKYGRSMDEARQDILKKHAL